MIDELRFEMRYSIYTVIIKRPQTRVALTFAMYERLAEIAARPGEAHVLIIAGADNKAFAAGTDISQLRAFTAAEDAIAYEARLDRVFSPAVQCKIPMTAAITVRCTGGCAGIVAGCGIRIATLSARATKEALRRLHEKLLNDKDSSAFVT
jgi:enoyl-CoA hydratase